MADTKISAMTAVAAVVDTHEFPVNESGASKKASAAQLKTYVQSGAPEVLAREVTLISIASSVTETDIFNQTIAANVMGNNRLLRLKILAARLNNSGATETAPTFRVYTGGTVRYADAVVALSTNSNWAALWIELLFAMQNATNAMFFNGLICPQSVAGGATTGIGNAANAAIDGDALGSASGTTFTQDTTANWDLRVTWQNGTNNANVIFRRHYAMLELL